MKHKHYSFDLWLTLIKSHPDFKRKRAEYFHENFNPTNKTVDEIEQIIREIDVLGTLTNEKVGKNIHPHELLSFVLLKLGNNDLNKFHLGALYNEIERIFLNYPPSLITSESKDIIHKLWDSGKTISILSNTGFISGRTLTTVLRHLGLDQHLSFSIYSDQVGLSKPNVLIFDLLISKAFNLHNDEINYDQIVHVGDNENADYKGAHGAGIIGMLIRGGNLKPLIYG